MRSLAPCWISCVVASGSLPLPRGPIRGPPPRQRLPSAYTPAMASKHFCSFADDEAAVRYRVLGKTEESTLQILCLHGLGSSSSTFQPPQSLLERGKWIIPDLVGHGDSSKPRLEGAYTMRAQAEAVLRVLHKEKVRDLFIIAHSMGGPISLELLEMCRRKPPILVRSLVYEEGNIDEGDCFGSKKLVENGPGETDESAALYHSAKDLVHVSVNGDLFKRLQDVMHNGVPVHFTYGEKNRGRFTSEKLLEQHGIAIDWVPEGGHSMHRDDGAQAFWRLIGDYMNDDT